MQLDDPDWLERMYNNRARVPEHGEYFARWAADSAQVRNSQPCSIDVPYGSGVNEALDVFPAQGAGDRAPVLVFIHGGYWRSLDKHEHSFIAPAFTRRGMCVVMPNYALCPGTDAAPVTISHIALQMARALAWTWRNIARYGGDPSRITVAGHSAGGHLVAMLLAAHWKQFAPDLPKQVVRNALAISGLFELEPIRRTPSFQASLRISPEEVLRTSPALWPAPAAGPLYAVAGGLESEEFIRQNEAIAKAWGPRKVPVCELAPGLDHFSIVDALADPAHRLHELALELLERRD
ncbi:MAG: alpha/beta hydrolase [Proteobacteria bacterium]|nr:alpha/beta hydrolase [Pseudomonadota bacterium]